MSQEQTYIEQALQEEALLEELAEAAMDDADSIARLEFADHENAWEDDQYSNFDDF